MRPSFDEHLAADVDAQVDLVTLGLWRVPPPRRRELDDLHYECPHVDALTRYVGTVLGEGEESLDRLAAVHCSLDYRSEVVVHQVRIASSMQRLSSQITVT